MAWGESGPTGGPARPGTHSFVRGATLLAAASLFSRLLGGLARIPLTRFLGGEGMGLFTMAYVVYTMAITFAVSGLCVATSRLVAQWVARGDTREAGRVLGASCFLGLASGVVFWVGLDRGATFLATAFLQDARAASALRAIAPAIVPVSLMAAFKGYFQGLQDMVPSSSSQVLEQVIRVVAMVWLVFVLRGEGVERAVGGAALGNTVGAMVALAYLVALFGRGQAARTGPARPGPGPGGRRSPRAATRARPGAAARGGAARQVLEIAVPVTVGALVLPLMDAMQTFLVPARLQAAGLDAREATYLYGQLHGMAYPLAGLPAVVASAMAAALIPAVADAVARREAAQVRSRTEAALRLTVMFSLPAAAGLWLLAEPICQMLFGIPEAGVPLAYVSAACLCIALQQASSGVLQGLGLVSVPVWGLSAGLAANTVATYFLTSVPGFGVRGAALGIVTGFLVAAVVNLVVVARETSLGLDLGGLLVRPGLATAAMGAAVAGVFVWVSGGGAGQTLATLLAIAAGVVVYALALVLVGGVRAEEAALIPGLGTWLGRAPRRPR